MINAFSFWRSAGRVAGALLLVATVQAAPVVQSLGLLPATADGAVLPWIGAVRANGEPLSPLLVFAGLVHANQVSTVKPAQQHNSVGVAGGALTTPGAYLTIVNSNGGQLLAQHHFAIGQYQGFAIARLARPVAKPADVSIQAAQTPTQTHTALVLLGATGVWTLAAPTAQNGSQPLAAARLDLLFQCPHAYAAIDADFFGPLPLVIDANTDGLDDFFLPGLQGHCLAVQQLDGTFVVQSLQLRLPVTLLMPPFERTQLSFELPTPPVVVDLNGDGRTDLLLGSNAAVGYFLQQNDGRFTSIAQPLPLPVALAGSERQVRQFKQLSRYQFERFEDINSDGTPDLLLKHQQYGEDLSESVSQLKVWYGAVVAKGTAAHQVAVTASDGVVKRSETASLATNSLETSKPALQLIFAGQPAVINLPGELVSLKFADFNGDHRLDASLLSAELGAGSLMSALMGNGVALDIRLYRQQANGEFGDKAAATHETTYTVDVGNLNFGVLFSVGHFTADTTADLLFINHKRQLQLVPGASSNLLTGKPQRLQAAIPTQLQWISVLDVEHDGIAELLLRQPQPDGQLALQLVRFVSPG